MLAAHRLLQRFSDYGSLLIRMPKIVEVDFNPNPIFRFLEHSKKSISYLLLRELFFYLKTSPLLPTEFPLLNNEPEYRENYMVCHVILLLERMLEESQQNRISEQEVQTLSYNARLYFYNQYAHMVHPYMPTEGYERHFAEAYDNRLSHYREQIREYPMGTSPKQLRLVFRGLIYKNRLELQDPELLKFCRYFDAHRKYLHMLDWSDIAQYRVKWGFEDNYKLIDTL